MRNKREFLASTKGKVITWVCLAIVAILAIAIIGGFKLNQKPNTPVTEVIHENNSPSEDEGALLPNKYDVLSGDSYTIENGSISFAQNTDVKSFCVSTNPNGPTTKDVWYQVENTEQIALTSSDVAQLLEQENGSVTKLYVYYKAGTQNYSYDGSFYNTLLDAYNAVVAAGGEGTITVEQDVTDNSTVVVQDGMNVTLQTNGHTITTSNRIEIKEGGELTIRGKGRIVGYKSQTMYTLYNTKGTLNVYDCTIECVGDSNSNNWYAVYNSGTFNLYSGKIITSKGTENTGSYTGRALTLKGTPTVNIRGGEIYTDDGQAIMIYASSGSLSGEVNIYDGYIHSYGSSITLSKTGSNIVNTNLNIYGGLIESETGNGISNTSASTTSNMVIGTIDQSSSPIIKGNNNGISNSGSGNFKFYSGAIIGSTAISGTNVPDTNGVTIDYSTNAEGKEVAKIGNYPNYKVGGNIYETLATAYAAAKTSSDHTITALASEITDDSTFTVENGDNIILNLRNSTINKTASVITIDAGATLTIEGNEDGKIISTLGDILTNNGNLNITSGIIETSGARVIYMNTATSKTNISGGTIRTTNFSSAIGVNIGGAKLTVTGGKIESVGGDGIYNRYGTTTIGTNGGDLNTITPEIIGGKYGIYRDGGTVYFYDGIAKGKSGGKSGTIADIDDRADEKTGTDPDNTAYKTYYLVRSSNYIVESNSGEGGYRTLEAALRDASSNDIIRVNKSSVTDTIAVTIANGKNITLNLGNNTLNKTGVITISAGATLTIEGNENGKILSSTNQILTNSGTLNITSGTIQTSGARCIYASSGNINISGGTIKSTSSSTSSYGIYGSGRELTVTGGKIESVGGYGIVASDITTIGTEDGNVNNATPEIKGGRYGISVWSSDTLKFYDGILKGKTAGLSGTIARVEANYEETTGIDPEDENYKTCYLAPTHNYSVDSKQGMYYRDFTQAYEVADSTDTIRLNVSNITNTTSWTIENGRNITFIIGNNILNTTSNITINAGGTLTIEGSGDGKILSNTGSGSRFIDNSGTLNLKGVTVQTSHYYVIFMNASTSKTNINGGTITTTNTSTSAYAISVNVKDARLNITSGKIESVGGRGIHNRSGTVTIGTNGGEISSTTPEIIGGQYGVYNDGGSVYFYDGIAKGKNTSLSGWVAAIDARADEVRGTEIISGEEYKTYYLVRNTNYTVDSKPGEYYKTFKEAYDAANAKDTIRYNNASTTDSSSFTIDDGRDITLNLGNNTLNKIGVITINAGGTLTLEGSGDGKIFSTSSSVLITNNGTLNIKGGMVQTSRQYVIYMNASTSKANISGGAIKTTYAASVGYPAYAVHVNNLGAELTVTGGKIESVNGHGICLTDGTATIGTSGDGVNTISPEIIGGIYGIYKGSSATLNFYDGVIKSSTNTKPMNFSETDANVNLEPGYGFKYGSGDGYYTAYLDNHYTVSFNAKGGTTPESIGVTYGETYGTLPTSTKADNTFDGWTMTDGGTDYVTSGDIYSIAGDSTLYAHWTPSYYTVTFNANGGTVSPASKQVRYGSNYGELPTPTRFGYTFDGWTTISGDTNYVTSGDTYNILDNSTLYAHWHTNAVTYVFGDLESNGDEYLDTQLFLFSEQNKNRDFEISATISELIPLEEQDDNLNNIINSKYELEPDYPGFVFRYSQKNKRYGFSSSVTSVDKYSYSWAEETPYINIKRISNYLYCNNDKINVDFSNIATIPTPLTFGAGLTADGTPFRFFKGRLTNIQVKMYYSDSELLELNPASIIPTEIKSIFTGWNINTPNGSMYNSGDILSGNTTLYANWAPVEYEISYDLNGGTIQNAQYTYNSYEGYTLPTPTKTGFEFAGWTGSNGNTPQLAVTIPQRSIGDKSYVANWVENMVTYRFGNVEFFGTNNIDTGMQLFNSQNKVKNFEISMGITSMEELLGEDGNNNTVFSDMNEKAVPYQGIVFRYNTSNHNYNVGANAIVRREHTSNYNANISNINMKKEGSRLYINNVLVQKNDGTGPLDYTDTVPITVPLTIGSSYKEGVGYFRFFKGTLSNIAVKLGFTNSELVAQNPLNVVPTRTGYNFIGWSTEPGGTLYNAGDTLFVSGRDYDLYANWSAPINYTISYDIANGEVSTPNPTTYNIESEAFTLNNPEREGYKFIGWTGANGETPELTVTISHGSWGNRSYTANWVRNNYQVGENFYVTLAEAYAAAKTAQDHTITAIAETITDSSTLTIESGNSIKLNLANSTITKTSSVITINAGGTLTIEGSEDGKITSTISQILTNKGTLNITSGTVQTSGAQTIYMNVATSRTNISGGYIKTTNTGSSAYAVYVYASDAQLKVTGGKIESIGKYGIFNSFGTSIIGTNEGEINISTPEIIGGQYGVHRNSGTVYFYDGVAKGKTAGKYGAITIDSRVDEVTDTDPEDATYYRYYLVRNTNYTVDSKSGEYYKTLAQAYAAANQTDTIRVNNASVTDTTAWTIASGYNITLSLGNNTLNRTSATTTINAGGTLTIEGSGDGTLKYMGETELVNNSGTLNITGGTIESLSSCAIMAYSATSKTNIRGGVVRAAYDSSAYGTICLSNEDAELTVTGGKIECLNGRAIYLFRGKVTVGIDGGEINNANPEIIGTSYSMYDGGGKVYFYDGILKGKTAAYYGGIDAIDERADKVNGEEIISGEKYYTYSLVRNTNYTVDSKSGEYYKTLSQAYAAANQTDTIRVNNASVTDTTSWTIASGDNITLSLGNNTLNKTSATIAINAGGTLTIEGSGDGTLKYMEGAELVNNSGTLNITGGTIQTNGLEAIYMVAATSKTNISGGYIKTTNTSTSACAIYVNNSSSVLKVTGGKIEGVSKNGIRLRNGTVTIGTSGDGVGTITPEIIGGEYGVYKQDATSTLNFYDGVIKSSTNVDPIYHTNNTNINPETGYAIRYGSGDGYYTAYLDNHYTVSFDANGGTTPESIAVTYGEPYGTLPTLNRDGYTFDGWTKTDGGTDYVTSEDTYAIAGNSTLHAHWTANSYTLTVNPNGGNYEGNTASQQFEQNFGTTKTIANPTRSYTVSFDSNGGSTCEDVTASYTFNNWTLTGEGSLVGTTYTYGAGNGTLTANYTGIAYRDITLPTPTRDGYTFEGWYTGENGTGTKITNETETLITEDVTLHANWTVNSYTLTVNPNGGTWQGNTASQQFEQNFGTTKEVANPTRSYTVSFDSNEGSTCEDVIANYTFNNWTLTGEGSLVGTTYTYGAGNGTLTANYTGIAYRDITLPTPTRDGYTFEGWYTGENGAGTKITNATETLITADITLHAHWIGNNVSYTVNHYLHDLGTNTYTLYSGDTVNGTTQSGTVGATITVANLAETIPGFTYEDAYTTGDTTKPANGAITEYTVPATGERVINLYYRRNYLYIQYHMNGGTWAGSNNAGYSTSGDLVTYTSNEIPTNFLRGVYGSIIGAVNITTYSVDSNGLHDYNSANNINITRNGYTNTSSSAWNTSADGEGRNYSQASNTNYDATTFATENGVNLASGDVVVTLYVSWTPRRYSITYNLDGGLNANSNPTSYTIESQDITLIAPYKPGYTFTGWTGSNGENQETNVTIPAGSTVAKTYTAHWTVNAPYTVTLDANGGNVSPNSVSVTQDTAFGTIPDPTRDGYTFNGWKGKNLFDEHNILKEISGIKYEDGHYVFSNRSAYMKYGNGNYIPITGYKENTQYTLSISGYMEGSFLSIYFGYTDGTSSRFRFDDTTESTRSITSDADKTINKITMSYGSSRLAHISHIQLEEGTSATTFEPFIASGEVTAETIYTAGADGIIHANWSMNEYTISYDLASGEVATPNPTTYTVETDSFTLINPTKEGYTFAGWTENSGDTPQTTMTITKGTTGNKTFTANWTINSYTLTVDPNGGSYEGNTASQEFEQNYGTTKIIANPTRSYTVSFDSNNGSACEDVTANYTFNNWSLSGAGSLEGTTYTYGIGNGTLTANYTGVAYKDITLPTPTRDGYTFEGWYTGENGTGTKITDTTETLITANITLHANWTVNSYTLTVNPNGGTWQGNTASQEFTQNYGTTKEVANPTRSYTVSFDSNEGSTCEDVIANYTFNNWTLTGEGSLVGTTYTYGAGNGTLTANYTGIAYRDITLPTPTRDGYTFEGWYTGENGTGTKITSETETLITANITLHANWTINSYTLTVNPNGGTWQGNTASQEFTQNYGTTKEVANPTRSYTVSFDSNEGSTCEDVTASYTFNNWTLTGAGILVGTTYTYGEGNGTLTANYTGVAYKDITLPTPTRTGYTFEGWYTEENGTGTKITNETETLITANTILHANWTTIEYTISYDLASGEVTTANLETYTIETETFTLNNPQRNGYTFTGWTGTGIDTPQTIVTITKGTTGSKSFVANWKKNNYQVGVNYYETLLEAYVAAKVDASHTITVVANEVRDASEVIIEENAEITLNIPVDKKIIKTVIGLAVYEGGKLIIDGSGELTTSIGTQLINTSGDVIVRGGTLSGKHSTGVITSHTIASRENGTITVEGGTVSSDNYVALYSFGTGNITISGGTVHSSGASVSTVSTNAGSACDVIVTGGTITNRDYVAVRNQGSGDIKISGGTIIANTTKTAGRGVSNSGKGNVEIRNAVITSNNIGVEASKGSITIENSEITATKAAVTNKATSGNITINGGTIISTTDVAILNNSSTGIVTIGTEGGNVSTTSPIIQTNATDKVAIDSSAGINFYDGVLKSKSETVHSGNVTTENGYRVKHEESGDYYIETLTSVSDYTVNYYGHDLGANTYTRMDTQTLSGNIGSTISVNDLKKTFTGFTYVDAYTDGNETKPTTNAITEATIAADGSTVINLYYRRNFLYVQYDINGGTLQPNAGENYGTSGSLVTRTTNATPTNFLSGVYGGIVGDIDDFDTYHQANDGANGLLDWNFATRISAAKTGYTAKSNGQWNTRADGQGTSFNQTKNDYSANTFAGADLANGDAIVTLYINWVPVKYTITYELDGGSVVGTNPTTYTIETESFTLINPTREGYTFTGWSGDNGNIPQTTVTISKGTTGNKNYTANWAMPKYVVNHYGHDLNATTYTLMESSEYTGLTGATLTTENLKKTFAGFTYVDAYTDGNETKPTSNAITEATIAADGSTVINMYYRRNYLYVQYDVNGGNLINPHGSNITLQGSLVAQSGSTQILHGFYGSNVGNTLSGRDVTYTVSDGLYSWQSSAYININKVGYIAKKNAHWNTKADGTGINYNHGVTTYEANAFAIENGGNLANGDVTVTLYVNWTPVEYTISYNLADGKVTNTNPTTYTVETETFTLNNPHKDGYTFVGWTGTGIDTPQTTVTISKGTTGNKNYTANWAMPKYVVNYYGHDLNATTYTLMESSEYTGLIGATLTTENLKKTFAGFTYVDAYTDGNETKPTSNAITEATIAADGSTVINMYYRRNYLYIQYVVNGASIASTHGNNYDVVGDFATFKGSTKMIRGLYGSKIGDVNILTYKVDNTGLHDYNNPTYLNVEKTGYVGKAGEEWNTAADGTGTSFDQNNSSYDANGFAGADLTNGDAVVTLYANWTPIEYTITYVLDDGSFEVEAPSTYTIETETFTLPVPVKHGYKFAGWSGDNGNTPEMEVIIAKGTTGNKRYVANWIFASYAASLTETRGGVTTTRNYETLQDAINAVSSTIDSGTISKITMLKDEELTSTVSIDQANCDIQIDLAGFVVSYTEAGTTAIEAIDIAGGNVELVDSSSLKTGELTVSGAGNVHGIELHTGAALKVNGAKVNASNTSNSTLAVGILANGGSVIVADGSVVASSTNNSARAIELHDNATISVTGGNIAATSNAGSESAIGIALFTGSEASVENGTVQATASGTANAIYANGGKFEMTNGNIHATGSVNAIGINATQTSKVTLNNGDILAENVSNGNAAGVIVSSSTIDLEGATIMASSINGRADGIEFINSSDSTIKGGSVSTDAPNGENYGISVFGSGKLTITKGSITAGKSSSSSMGLFVNSPSFEVTLGTKDGDVSTSEPCITGYNIGTNVTKYNFYDGVIRSVGTTIVNEPTNVEEHYTTTNGTAQVNGEVYNTTFLRELGQLLDGTITIEGVPEYDEVLRVNTTNIIPGADNCTYRWWYSEDSGATNGLGIDGGFRDSIRTNNTDLVGKYIGVTVTATKEGYETTTFTTIIGPIEKIAINPEVHMVSYVYGKTVSVPYVIGNDDNGRVTYYYSSENTNSDGTEWYNIGSRTLDVGTYYMYAVVNPTDTHKGATTAPVMFKVTEIESSLTVSQRRVTLKENNKVTVTYEYIGDGEIVASANPAGIATATVDNVRHTITLTGKSEGTTTVTVSSTNETNYNTVSATIDVTVEAGNYSVTENGVTNYYTTLAEAYNAITGSNGTIKVEKNNLDNSTVNVGFGKTIVLDTNGNVITKTGSSITNNGNLQIIGNGTIQTLEGSENSLGVLINNTGKLDIDNCVIENKGSNTDNWYAISSTGGTVNVNGGTVKATTSTGSDESHEGVAIKVTGNTILNVIDGTVSSDNGPTILAKSSSEGASNGSINISGGNVLNTSESTSSSKRHAIEISSDYGYTATTNVVVTGGNVSSTNGIAIANESQGKITIGTDDNTVNTASPVVQGKSAAVSTNGVFNLYDGVLKGENNPPYTKEPSIPEGYYVEVVKNGNVYEAKLTQDATAPVIKAGDPSKTLISKDDMVSMEITVTEKGAGFDPNELKANDFTFIIDGEVITPTTVKLTYVSNENGEYKYTLEFGGISKDGSLVIRVDENKIYDEAGIGNALTTLSNGAITVDVSKPVLNNGITLTKPTDGVTEDGEYAANITGVQDSSGIAKYIWEIRNVESERWTTINEISTSVTASSITGNVTEEGIYQIRVRVIDTAGNEVLSDAVRFEYRKPVDYNAKPTIHFEKEVVSNEEVKIHAIVKSVTSLTSAKVNDNTSINESQLQSNKIEEGTWQYRTEIIYSAHINGVFKFEVTDAKGNVVTGTYNVVDISRTATSVKAQIIDATSSERAKIVFTASGEVYLTNVPSGYEVEGGNTVFAREITVYILPEVNGQEVTSVDQTFSFKNSANITTEVTVEGNVTTIYRNIRTIEDTLNTKFGSIGYERAMNLVDKMKVSRVYVNGNAESYYGINMNEVKTNVSSSSEVSVVSVLGAASIVQGHDDDMNVGELGSSSEMIGTADRDDNSTNGNKTGVYFRTNDLTRDGNTTTEKQSFHITIINR